MQLTAERVEMTNRAGIEAATFGPGDAGGVAVSAGRLELREGARINTGTGGSGKAGTLEVAADTVVISGVLTSGTSGSGPSGNIRVTAGSVRVTEGGVIFSGTSGSGRGGDIEVTAEQVTIAGTGPRGPSVITSLTAGSGQAGTIRVTAGSVRVTEGGVIFSGTAGSGRGGNIEVTAEQVTIAGFGPMRSPTDLDFSAIASTASQGDGSAGDVRITAGSLHVLDGGKLATTTFSAGKAGTLVVSANQVLVAGEPAELSESLRGLSVDPRFAKAIISAGSNRLFFGDAATGSGGEVRIQAGTLEVRNGGLIETATMTPGQGGNIEILADRVTLASGGAIVATSEGSATAGKAGNITITARESFQSDSGAVTTEADQAEGGAITITAKQVQLSNALISAKSAGAGNAGRIRLTVGDRFEARNSAVTTEARQADGGDIELRVGRLMQLRDSEITASVGGGATTIGGNITLDSGFVILERSQISANALEGQGGNIHLSADAFLADPASRVSASSALGLSGTVNIRAPATSVTGSLVPLPQDFLQMAALLPEPCAARVQRGKSSSLVLRGRDGLPLEPGGLLPSPLHLDERLMAGPVVNGEPGRQRPPARFALLDSHDKVLPRMGMTHQHGLSRTARDLGCSR